MPDITKFKCKACDGTGGAGPLRVATGKPFHPCMYCNGTGNLRRSVDNMWDRVGHMAAVSDFSRMELTERTPRMFELIKEQEAARRRKEWDDVSGGLEKPD